jgi:hypothetical protein
MTSYKDIAEVRLVTEEQRTRGLSPQCPVVNELLEAGWRILTIAASSSHVYDGCYIPSGFTYCMGRPRVSLMAVPDA